MAGNRRGLSLERIREFLQDEEEEAFDESDEELGLENDLPVLLEADHDSNSELSDAEEPTTFTNPQPTSSAQLSSIHSSAYFLGKDQSTKWNKTIPSQRVRQRSHNIATESPGPKGPAKNAKSKIDCFLLFFDKSIVELLIKHTNEYICSIRDKFQRERDAKEVTYEEMLAFFGLLAMSGVLRSSHLNFLDLWASDGTGIEFFSDTMSAKRFLFILRCLRFDDASSRQSRLTEDKLAPIRDFCDILNENFRKHYTLSEYVTVDEQLPAFRGRFSGLVYMPSKPNKYGIKHYAMVDAKTAYLQKFEVYVGKQPDGPYNIPNDTKSLVKRLTEPIKNTGRNITMDNYFTSIELAKDTIKDKLTIVGTLRKNKKEIPQEFLPDRRREVHSTLFGFHENLSMCSYVSKKSKAVLVLSSMHHDDKIGDGEQKKPEMILFYNKTKGGVDTNDKLCSTYNVARRTKRWPMVIFFHLFNVSAINAFVIYNCNNDATINRRIFLKLLSTELVKSHRLARAVIPSLPSALKNRLSKQEVPGPSSSSNDVQTRKRGRCYICPRNSDRKTTTKCNKCAKFICGDHTKKICDNC